MQPQFSSLGDKQITYTRWNTPDTAAAAFKKVFWFREDGLIFLHEFFFSQLGFSALVSQLRFLSFGFSASAPQPGFSAILKVIWDSQL